MQIIPQEKDLAMGINGFEGVGPEWLLPQKKESLFAFWKKVRFEGGERETDLLVHAHWTNSLFFLVSFLFFSVFFLALFFSFHFVKYTLFFDPPSTGHGKGFFIAPAVASVLRSCPLTAFVWFGCTYWPHCATPTLARQRRACFIPLYVIAFLPATTLMPFLSTLRACTQRFPLKLPLLGGLSSQQDVPPKRGLGRSRE